jgi:hypothetical protein
MRHFHRAMLSICAAVYLSIVALAQTPFPCKITAANPNCLTIGPALRAQGWVVGEIKTFAVGADSKDLIGQLAKQGWVEAAGQSAIRKDFDELWKIMGTDWGSADNTNVFFLPDLRGLLLRGWNHSKTPPKDFTGSPYNGELQSLADQRVSPRPEFAPTVGNGGSSGDHVGSMESDMVGSHTHKYARNANSYHLANDDHTAQNIWGDWNTNADTGAAGGPETHPPNAYVMYFIYVGKPAQVIEPTDTERGDPKTRTGRIACIKNTNGRCKT